MMGVYLSFSIENLEMMVIRNKLVILQKIRTELKEQEQIHQRQKRVNTATMPTEI